MKKIICMGLVFVLCMLSVQAYISCGIGLVNSEKEFNINKSKLNVKIIPQTFCHDWNNLTEPYGYPNMIFTNLLFELEVTEIETISKRPIKRIIYESNQQAMTYSNTPIEIELSKIPKGYHKLKYCVRTIGSADGSISIRTGACGHIRITR